MGTTAQTLRAKFHTALRINCVGFWGKTRTSFRANVEKKTNVYLCAVFRVHVRADFRADFGSKCFLRRGLRKVQADFRGYLYVSVFFFCAHSCASFCAYLRTEIHANFTRLFRAQHLRAILDEPLRDPQRKVYASLHRNFGRNFRGQLPARTSAHACAETSRETLTPMSAQSLTPNFSMFCRNFHAHSTRTSTQLYCGRFGANLEAGAPEAPFSANCRASFQAIFHVVSREIFRRNFRAFVHASFYIYCYVDCYANFHSRFRAEFRRNLSRKLPTARRRKLSRALIRVFIRIFLLELHR